MDFLKKKQLCFSTQSKIALFLVYLAFFTIESSKFQLFSQEKGLFLTKKANIF